MRAQALEDEVPKGEQWGKGPGIEGLIGEGQPGGQELSGQQFVESAEELGWAEGGAQKLGVGELGWLGSRAPGRRGLEFEGVFFEGK
jgi:hypothetical protein